MSEIAYSNGKTIFICPKCGRIFVIDIETGIAKSYKEERKVHVY